MLLCMTVVMTRQMLRCASRSAQAQWLAVSVGVPTVLWLDAAAVFIQQVPLRLQWRSSNMVVAW